MALTKVTGSVIKDSVSLSGNVSVGGTLTYQDVTNVDALGIGTFRTGIDITGGNLTIPDKIIHSGDTNTSLRFPSADTITAETGGAERFRIDSSGRVMIGTTTEGVHTADDLTIAAANGTTGITLRSGTGNPGNIFFSDATSGDAEYVGFIQYYHADNSMRIATNNATRLHIKSDGKVGVGTDSPLSVLTAYGENRGEGTVTGQITAKDNAAYNASPTAGIIFQGHYASNNAQAIFSGITGFKENANDGNLAGALAFHVRANGAVAYEALRINSSGQLIMTNAATKTFFDFSTTNNTTRGLFSVSGKDGSGNAVTVKIGGFGDTSRGEIFTHSNHSLGFATNNAAAQVILHTSGLFDVVGECRATNFYLRGNGSAPTADASIFRPANNTLAFATASTERIRIENSGISGTIKNNYALVAFVSDRDDGSRSTGATSYQDDTGLVLTNAINYRHGDIFFVRVLVPIGIALVSTDTTNYQGVYLRIKITPSSGTTRYSTDTRGWYRNDGRATKETMQLVTTYYHLTASNTSQFNDNVNLSFQVQYHRDGGGVGSYGATGLSVWSGERTMEVWQFRKQL